MFYRLVLLLLLALTVSMLPWTQVGKAAAPTGETADPSGMETFEPSRTISIDNAVSFPVDI